MHMEKFYLWTRVRVKYFYHVFFIPSCNMNQYTSILTFNLQSIKTNKIYKDAKIFSSSKYEKNFAPKEI